MRETYDRVGLVHLTNTGLTDLVDMRAAAKLVIDAEMPYDGGANPRDNIAPNVYEIGAPALGLAPLPPRDGLRRPQHTGDQLPREGRPCPNRAPATTA